MYLIQNQYSILYVLLCHTIYTLRNIQHFQYESLNNFWNTNNVGIVSWENFEMEEYMPKIIDGLLGLR